MRTARACLLFAALALPMTLPAIAQTAAPAADTSSAILKLEGAIPTPLTLTSNDLAKLPRSTAALTSDGNTTTYEGVLLYDLLTKAGWQFGRGMTGKGMASYILATARDGYQVTFTPGDIDPLFGNIKILIADKADNAPLPAREAPFRIIVPGDKMHARSLFSVVKIEVVRLRP
jgi:DMSO/TMAO reductase YedYZ molybdopterin-dependent catalytic subunit